MGRGRSLAAGLALLVSLNACSVYRANVFIRAMEGDNEISVDVRNASSGQFLGETPFDIWLTQTSFRKPRLPLSLVAEHPGYHTQFQMMVVDHWGKEAKLSQETLNQVKFAMPTECGRQISCTGACGQDAAVEVDRLARQEGQRPN